MILKRHEKWPEQRLSTVEPAWKGQTVVCIATGASLTPEQVAQVRASGAPTIAINDAYLLAPFAALLYFADAKWWRWQVEKPEWKAFAGERCSIFMGKEITDKSIHLLENAKQAGLSTDPGAICTGSNSGYQAVNIATLAGARRVVLVGYDGQPFGGRHHFFGDHPDKSHPPYEVIRARFRELIEPTRAIGCEIVNASPGSKIDCFRMVPLEESLQPHPRPALV